MDKDRELIAKHAGATLTRIREQGPLVHNITNYVVMNFTANALLALGASPVMAHAVEEVEEMVSLSAALVLNIGTLSREWIESMLRAGKKAAEMNIPVILDPVGAGATRLRTQTARQIIDHTQVSLIRGNASEIISISKESAWTKGVDSIHSVHEATHAAQALARELGTGVAITGPTDLVTDGRRAILVDNGHPMMGRATGTGCVASALCAAFLAVDTDLVRTGASALALCGMAGEQAGDVSSGPGSFQPAFLDALYRITPEELMAGSKFEVLYV